MKLAETLKSSQGSRSAPLDGVRGLAVIVLLLYHFGVSALQGAWVGLSLFFVFSGYVIVTIMLKEHARFGRIDYVEFYRRRARRLLPALFVLIMVVAGWAIIWGDHAVRRPMKGDILATLGFVMNWRLVSQADQYFVEFANPSFFRHVWTLSVEEQFYLVAPFLVAFLIRRVGSRWLRVGVIVALAAASALWAAHVGLATTEAQAQAYYGTASRVQSLLAGMAVAFALGPDRTGVRLPQMSTRTAGFWAWTATLTSIVCFFVVPPLSSFMFERGGLFALSMLTAVGLAGAVRTGPGPFRRVFTLGPLVYLGMLTYGLYLWHWPVKLWMDRYLPDLSLGPTLLIGAASTMALAVVSFHLLEVPVMVGGLRQITGSAARARLFAVGSTVAVVIAAFAVGRVPSVQEDIAAGRVPMLVDGTESYVPGPDHINAGLVGDSVPYYLAERFPAETYSDLTIDNFAVPGCGLLPWATYWAPEYQEPVSAACVSGRRDLTAEVRAANSDVVLLMVGSDLGAPHQRPDGTVVQIGDPEYRAEVEAQLDDLRERALAGGATQIQLATLPCRELTGRNFGDLPFDSSWYQDHPEIARRLSDPTEVNSWFRAWAEQYDDVALIDVYEVMGCERGYTPKINGITLFRDAMHYSEEATPMIWTWLAPQMRSTYQAATG